jgi:hypothetical protein
MFVRIGASGSSGAIVNFVSSQEGGGTLPRVEFCWINLYALVLYPPERLRLQCGVLPKDLPWHLLLNQLTGACRH